MLRCSSLVVFAMLSACGTKARGAQFEREIVAWAKAKGVVLTQVTCPGSIKVAIGTTFECVATVDNGEEVPIAVNVASKSGNNFEYTIAYATPTYVSEEIATYLDLALTQQLGVKPRSLTCGSPGLRKVPTARRVTCSATTAQGVATPIAITFGADGTVLTWAAQ